MEFARLINLVLDSFNEVDVSVTNTTHILSVICLQYDSAVKWHDASAIVLEASRGWRSSSWSTLQRNLRLSAIKTIVLRGKLKTLKREDLFGLRLEAWIVSATYISSPPSSSSNSTVTLDRYFPLSDFSSSFPSLQHGSPAAVKNI